MAVERGSSVAESLSTELIAVVVAVTAGEPRVLTIRNGAALPSGSFESGHRSLQAGLRSWVERQTHQPLGYVEQLYTFADSDRADSGRRVISVSYLGLAREGPVAGADAGWHGWYRYFPWEDHRGGAPDMIGREIAPALARWAGHDPARRSRAAITFGLQDQGWNEEWVLQRYELLYEAGLVPERARRDPVQGAVMLAGEAMALDHRRILATGIARLRAKIKYRPVFFELMPEVFTLGQLQQTVEALAGRGLHTQNFRRLIEAQRLVEDTGQMQTTGGRPARLVRYRGEIQSERAIVGTKLPLARS